MARKSDRLQNSAAFWVLGVCGTFKERCSAVGTRTQVRILAKKNECESSYVITKYHNNYFILI